MIDPVDPNTGAPLHRDIRPLTLTYQGNSMTSICRGGMAIIRTRACSILRT
jgi:hypothetical protein